MKQGRLIEYIIASNKFENLFKITTFESQQDSRDFVGNDIRPHVIMVANQISMLLKQALTTFTSKRELFNQNLEILKAILDKTTSNDVDLHPQFMTEALWKKQNKAPVTYIDIFEDETLTMGVFILKPGMKIPLHDHPQMHGLIKVIAGKVKITSFTVQVDNPSQVDSRHLMYPNNLQPMILLAEKHQELIAEPSSESCVLEPISRNIHEVESVDGPAAFLDILSPPYESEIANYGPRKCSYFRIMKEIKPHFFKLEEIKAPSWFWNDTYPYTGPELQEKQKMY